MPGVVEKTKATAQFPKEIKGGLRQPAFCGKLTYYWNNLLSSNIECPG